MFAVSAQKRISCKKIYSACCKQCNLSEASQQPRSFEARQNSTTKKKTEKIKNNKWVKNCLDLGFKKNSEVAKCAERQELAHYEYLKIKNENERIKNELAQADQYQKQILEEQRRANDMQSNQMLLNLSQELMGLNNNNNRSFNCITNPVGWSCRQC